MRAGPRSRARTGARVAGLIAILALATGCGSADPAGPAASPLALIGPQGLQLVQGGIPGPLPGTIPLAGDLSATATLIDRPAVYERHLELRLFRGENQAAVVNDADIGAHAEMVLMDHDPFDATAADRGEGTYLLALPFTMAGEWQLDLVITTPDETADLVLSLDVLD